MTKTIVGAAAGVMALTALAGCGAGDPSVAVGSESAALLTNNGQMQNGQMQNGQMQNGQMQNGIAMALTGVDLATMHRLVHLPAAGEDPDVSDANLVAVPNVRLYHSTLSDGLRGSDFRHHVVKGTFSDGQIGWVYLADIAPSPDDPDIVHYTLRARHVFHPQPGYYCPGHCPLIWDDVCGSITETATAVGGQWNYESGVPGGGRKLIEQSSAAYDRQITFACGNGAIGKCVERAGYKPWALAKRECRTTNLGTYCQQPTQELLHEACVRMVRADYCGNGQDHTVNGVAVDVWDQTVNTETPYSTDLSVGVPYGHEAEWTPNGARCLNDAIMPRASSVGVTDSVRDYLNNICPNKWAGQANQQKPFAWDDGDCFGRTIHVSQPWVSVHSTYDFANVPMSGFGVIQMDLHDRVLIKNKSVCIDDGLRFMPPYDYSNPMASSWFWWRTCLPQLENAPL